MKTKYSCIIVSVVFILSACETEIPFNLENYPPKLMLNALLEVERDTNYISLGLSGRDYVTFIDDAKIDIYINNELKEEITEASLIEDIWDYQKINVYPTTVKFLPGDLVRIDAKTNDGKYHAWAEDVVPESIGIENIDTATFIGKIPELDDREFYSLYLRLTFTDEPAKKNYYRLALAECTTWYGISESSEMDTVAYKGTYNLSNQADIVLNEGKHPSNNLKFPVAEVENSFNVFDDSRLNGPYTMQIGISLLSRDVIPGYLKVKQTSKQLKVRLISITESEFYYLKALNLYASTDFDFFMSQSTSLPSNVHGGIGIVGFEAGTTHTIVFPDYYPE